MSRWQVHSEHRHHKAILAQALAVGRSASLSVLTPSPVPPLPLLRQRHPRQTNSTFNTPKVSLKNRLLSKNCRRRAAEKQDGRLNAHHSPALATTHTGHEIASKQPREASAPDWSWEEVRVASAHSSAILELQEALKTKC